MNLSYGNPTAASLLEYSRAIDCFCSYSANVTALPAYSATSLGPVLWNGLNAPGVSGGGYPERKAIIIGISLAVTTASTAAVGVGLAWGNSAVSAGVAATLTSSTYPTNKQPAMTSYSSANVAAAATGFLPLFQLPTSALTVLPSGNIWIPVDGAIVLQEGGWVALAATATATTSVLQYSIVWVETAK